MFAGEWLRSPEKFSFSTSWVISPFRTPKWALLTFFPACYLVCNKRTACHRSYWHSGPEKRGERRQEGLWVLNSNPSTAPLKSRRTLSGQKKHTAAPAQFYVTGFKTPVIRSCANVRLEFKVCHFSHWGLCYVALCGQYETTCPWSAPISLWCKSHAWLAARNLSVHLRANRLY